MKIKNKLYIFSALYLVIVYTLSNSLLHISLFHQYLQTSINTDVVENKVIYLTFDDGPSTNVTSKILDTLKTQDVKATFFVVGYKIDGREDLLRRIHNEGHSIGLHTYTHKYKEIYSSDEAFINEMDKTADKIKSVIGIDCNIIRFPSGSKKHLTTSMLEKLHEKNYKIFDWNLSLSDGLDCHTSPDKLLKEATQKCVCPNKIFLLLHCDQPNKTTCEALEGIICHYKKLGYDFKCITNSTPEYHFRVSK
ncbi:polysaccharide deacetylase family protein [Clostridium sp. DJ247]|uniref:polysaccharide deacetylase family protein n=1 Tax=Clostridium sp. DJ247 TaxID=2726188 RepID=UPI0028BD262F|nr:polysaccharide deacetylase family protein [Clostridium sp. DJ247]